MTYRKPGFILLLVCMLFLVIPPIQAVSMDTSVSPPLIGASLPNLFQEKPKTQWDWVDFRLEGEKLMANGNYEDAITHFNQAEMMVMASSSESKAGGAAERAVANLEKLKGDTYL